MLIDAELRAAIDTECARHPRPEGGLFAALHRVRRAHGAITPALAGELAEIFGIRPLEILELVSVHPVFEGEPGERHRITVCRGLSCALRGGRRLLAEVEAHLGILAGGVSEDGRVVVAGGPCQGGCGGAPVVRIDETLHEDLDVEAARRLLDGLE